MRRRVGAGMVVGLVLLLVAVGVVYWVVADDGRDEGRVRREVVGVGVQVGDRDGEAVAGEKKSEQAELDEVGGEIGREGVAVAVKGELPTPVAPAAIEQPVVEVATRTADSVTIRMKLTVTLDGKPLQAGEDGDMHGEFENTELPGADFDIWEVSAIPHGDGAHTWLELERTVFVGEGGLQLYSFISPGGSSSDSLWSAEGKALLFGATRYALPLVPKANLGELTPRLVFRLRPRDGMPQEFAQPMPIVRAYAERSRVTLELPPMTVELRGRFGRTVMGVGRTVCTADPKQGYNFSVCEPYGENERLGSFQWAGSPSGRDDGCFWFLTADSVKEDEPSVVFDGDLREVTFKFRLDDEHFPMPLPKIADRVLDFGTFDVEFMANRYVVDRKEATWPAGGPPRDVAVLMGSEKNRNDGEWQIRVSGSELVTSREPYGNSPCTWAESWEQWLFSESSGDAWPVSPAVPNTSVLKPLWTGIQTLKVRVGNGFLSECTSTLVRYRGSIETPSEALSTFEFYRSERKVRALPTVIPAYEGCDWRFWLVIEVPGYPDKAVPLWEPPVNGELVVRMGEALVPAAVTVSIGGVTGPHAKSLSMAEAAARKAGESAGVVVLVEVAEKDQSPFQTLTGVVPIGGSLDFKTTLDPSREWVTTWRVIRAEWVYASFPRMVAGTAPIVFEKAESTGAVTGSCMLPSIPSPLFVAAAVDTSGNKVAMNTESSDWIDVVVEGSLGTKATVWSGEWHPSGFSKWRRDPAYSPVNRLVYQHTNLFPLTLTTASDATHELMPALTTDGGLRGTIVVRQNLEIVVGGPEANGKKVWMSIVHRGNFRTSAKFEGSGMTRTYATPGEIEVYVYPDDGDSYRWYDSIAYLAFTLVEGRKTTLTLTFEKGKAKLSVSE